jgi:hypothetical protein
MAGDEREKETTMHLPRLLRLLMAVALIVSVAFVAGGATRSYAATVPGPLATAAGFEDNDGNLTPQAPINFDWNSFAPLSWQGTAPYQNASNLVNGWTFLGLTDAQKSATDTSFAGGTKQDLNCPTVIASSVPNKDDLKRAYMTTKTVGGQVYLELAWVRIPQNTTSASAHIAFEFNQGTQACGATSGGLVYRTVGDMLVLYDFSGGGTPTLGLERWTATGPCEVKADAPPCWGTEISPLPASQAEGAVNTGVPPYSGATIDNLAPVAPQMLGVSEFGEAGLNLSAAGVFNSTTCTSFGTAWAVSRSSGSASTAQMEDLVGPGHLPITNCGQVNIIKHTDPRGQNANFTFTSTLTGAQLTCTQSTAGSFTLNDSGNTTADSAANTQSCTNVPAGTYYVTEGANPTGFVFEDLTCSATGTDSSVTPNGDGGNNSKTATITVAGGGVITCTYTNLLMASPTITTTLVPPSPVDVGTAVHDTASLSGAFGTPTGTVTYTVYTNNLCTLGAVDAGTNLPLTNGAVPDSNPITFNTSGTFYWQAVYSGDTHNNGATSACTSETLIVKATPSITTKLSATTGKIGDSITDSSALSGASTNPAPTGTVTYTVYTNSLCTLGGVFAGTVTLASGLVPNSSPITFTHAGIYYWQAVYSGDTFNEPATSGCTSETLIIAPNQPTISTAPSLIPNDSATIASATSDAAGTVVFQLFAPGDTTCKSTPVYSQTKTLTGNDTVATSNTTISVSTLGTYRWLVSYSDGTDNLTAASACGVEQFTLANTQ